MSLCDCAFGPRCESNFGCAADDQSTGIKDTRTGEVRMRARWSVIREPFRKFHKLHVRFYCAECWEHQQEVDRTPLVGIDRPEHASDFWRPSITEHIRLTAIESSRQRKATEPAGHGPASSYELERMRRWSPAQRSQAEFVRRQMRR